MIAGVGVEAAVEAAVVEMEVNKVELELGKEMEVALDEVELGREVEVELTTASLHKCSQILE